MPGFLLLADSEVERIEVESVDKACRYTEGMQYVHQLDQTVTRLVQGITVSGFGQLMAFMTYIGEGTAVSVLVGFIAVVALVRRAYVVAGALLVTEVLMLAYNMIKLLFHRTRPDTPYAATLHTTSFPSGHAADSVAAFGLIGYLLFTRLPHPWNWTGVVVGLLFPLLIGMSRVYLGAHYPSDVLGGWIIAGIGLVIVIAVFRL